MPSVRASVSYYQENLRGGETMVSQETKITNQVKKNFKKLKDKMYILQFSIESPKFLEARRRDQEKVRNCIKSMLLTIDLILK